MVFSTKRKRGKTADFEVKCGGSSIKRVHSVRYLGVVLDECLSGEDHALATISKISARIAFLYRNAHLLTFRCKQTLCTALIQPYFDYCCSSCYTGLAVKHKKKLDVLQRKMVRLVFNQEPRDHVGQEHFQKLKWFRVPDRVRYFKMIHVFKIHSQRAPRYISESFKRVSEIHSHGTRQSNFDFHLCKADSLGPMSNSFRFSATKEWNGLPTDVKSSQNEHKFKASLKAFLFK